MKKILLMVLCVGLLAAKDDVNAKKPKSRYPLGKETTYVTEPLDADGYIDYAAALNARMHRGVKPANNANVLLWKAFGPHPGGDKMPTDFFKWMDMEPPPEHGDYYIPLSRYMEEQLKSERIEWNDPIYNELGHCSLRPWKAKEHPNIAGWLKANEKPLVLVLKATRRSRYFSPFVPRKTSEGASGLFDPLMPVVQKCRALANALTARAMLSIAERRFDDAWQDLLACHRLGRHVGHGATLTEALIGISIDEIAERAELVFLERAGLDAKALSDCLRDLQRLPPLPCMADKVDIGDRFIFLDAVEMLARDVQAEASKAILKIPTANIDWEPALRIGNKWFDRMAKAMRAKDRTTREKQLKQIEEELKALHTKAEKELKDLRSGFGSFKLILTKDADKVAGEKVGNMLICLMTPAAGRAQNAAERSEQMQNNLHLAFALAAYHRDHGRYPKELDALAPKYLDKIPKDMFSGKPLIYRPTANGYLLYSVGVNARDEQGRSYDTEPPGDDLTIRMPLPKLKRR